MTDQEQQYEVRDDHGQVLFTGTLAGCYKQYPILSAVEIGYAPAEPRPIKLRAKLPGEMVSTDASGRPIFLCFMCDKTHSIFTGDTYYDMTGAYRRVCHLCRQSIIAQALSEKKKKEQK